jgi:hypothetical protein
LPEMGEMFIQVLNQAVQEANRKNDAERMPKLQQVVAVLQQASAPPPELQLLETFLAAPDEAALDKLIEEHAAEITPEFSAVVASIINRTEGEGGEAPPEEEKQMLKKIQSVYKAVLKFSMKKSLK